MTWPGEPDCPPPGASASAAPLLPGVELEGILGLVAASGLDLRDYGRETLARRVLARMAAVGAVDARAYRELLARDTTEVAQLAAALLVKVTSFFREPQVFRALEQHVLPGLMAEASSTHAPLRAWVVGAATGEEAYSLAAVLAPGCRQAGTPFEVVASDRSEAALQVARDGLYPEEQVEALPEPYRERLFDSPGRPRAVAPALREHVRFCHHDFMGARLAPSEAVLASFDLVLCRNVLIYLDARFRSQAFDRLGEVVRGGGALVLGHSEFLPPALGDRFVPYPGVEPSLRIYSRRERRERLAGTERLG